MATTKRKAAVSTTPAPASLPVAKPATPEVKSAVKPAKAAAKPAAKATAAKPAAARKPAAGKPVAAKTASAPKAAAGEKVAVAKPRTPRRAPTATAGNGSVSAAQRRNYIEVAAYYIAERRSFAPGNPLDDWVQAEAEIDRLITEGSLGKR